jgi:hypothetical protein
MDLAYLVPEFLVEIRARQDSRLLNLSRALPSDRPCREKWQHMSVDGPWARLEIDGV